VKQVGRELGVRYVLEGSVRKGGSRVRITAQLIDAETGTHLWADRFDGSMEDVFELQDQVATSVAGVIEPALQASEILRAAARPTPDLTAYDLYLRALPAMYSYSNDGILAALRLLDEATARDPDYAPALGAAANCRIHLDLNGWGQDAEENRRAALDCGRRALAAAGDDPDVLANAAAALAYFGEDLNTMIAVVDRALALNPSFARGWYVSGTLRQWAGDPDATIERIEKSLRLSPRARVGNQLAMLGSAYMSKRRFDEAASKFLMAIQQAPGAPLAYRALAACYAHLGRLAEAREIVERLRALGPLALSSGVTPAAPNSANWSSRACGWRWGRRKGRNLRRQLDDLAVSGAAVGSVLADFLEERPVGAQPMRPGGRGRPVAAHDRAPAHQETLGIAGYRRAIQTDRSTATRRPLRRSSTCRQKEPGRGMGPR
jgi:adenylate cyclase